ncbi:MAG: hypothetical protein K2K26_12390 [Muribaculaceae bacterium]|nr:hypothetical protein [Muribaculaceae bacterium]
MKKILIIGCGGSGKSTFARKLAEKTGLPLHYLDMIWHRSDHTTISQEEFDTKLEEILKNDTWIIDGNYQRTMPRRLQEADTVFFFDLPVEACIEGVTNRIGRQRPDMPWIENSLDPQFLQWITNFPTTRLPIIRQLLDNYSGTVIRFTDRQEANDYINNLS